MSRRLAYVNGAFVPIGAAAIEVEDRGFQFADAIYEVWGVRGGRWLDDELHMARLQRSLREMQMMLPMSEAALRVVLKETLRRNRVQDGLIYLQFSRGAAPRDHAFPNPGRAQTIVITAKPMDMRALEKAGREGVAVVTMADERWARCDIKSTSLLPNVLAKQKAREAGANEAWLIDRDGLITEGSSTSAWIVDASGRLRTRALSNAILPGVTRARLMEIAQERQISVIEEAFTREEALAAREAFFSAATNGPVPVVRIDGANIGDGKPGPLTRALRDAYFGAGRPEK